MCVKNDGRMTYEVEVESNGHNSRFYELRNRSLNALHDILKGHSRAVSVEVVVSSFDNAREKSRFHWKRQNVKLDALIFAELPNLERLSLRLNGMIGLTLSAPFYLPITELCMSDVEMPLYDLSLFLRSVGQTLHHLCLRRFAVTDPPEDHDAPPDVAHLKELERIRRLETFRIDRSFEDILPALKAHLPTPLVSLFVDSLDLDALHDADNTHVAGNIFAKQVVFRDEVYTQERARSLQLAAEDLRRRTKPRERTIRLVLGLPECWSPLAQQTSVRQLLILGRVQICALVPNNSFVGADEVIETLIKLWV